MGGKLSPKDLIHVVFEGRDGHCKGFLPMEVLLSTQKDPELLATDAAKLYELMLERMRSLVTEMAGLRAKRQLVPARTIWKLGDCIFELKNRLATLSLQLDDTYGHLSRDLIVKRKWLEKVIIFRRYVPSEELIPTSLNWGRCEKGTRRVAENLRDGVFPTSHQSGK